MDWFALLAVQDSEESSPTPQFKNINSLALSFLYSPTLTSIHDYWNNPSFDCDIEDPMRLEEGGPGQPLKDISPEDIKWLEPNRPKVAEAWTSSNLESHYIYSL